MVQAGLPYITSSPPRSIAILAAGPFATRIARPGRHPESLRSASRSRPGGQVAVHPTAGVGLAHLLRHEFGACKVPQIGLPWKIAEGKEARAPFEVAL
jgi:hypothetical protein